MSPRSVLVPSRIRRPSRDEEVRSDWWAMKPSGACVEWRRGWEHCIRRASLCSAALGLGAQLASAPAAAGPGAFSIGIEGGGRVFDAMSVGEVRPQPRGEVIGAVEVGYAVTGNWSGSVSWRFGGSW